MRVALQLALLLVAGLLAQIPARAPRRLAVPRAWRTGDMILFRTTDVIFRLSSIITRSEFSHIGVVVAPPAAPAPMIIESLDAGHHSMPDLWTGRVKAGPYPLRTPAGVPPARGGYAVVRLHAPGSRAAALDRVRRLPCPCRTSPPSSS